MLQRYFFETEEYANTCADPLFAELFAAFLTLSEDAPQELVLPPEPDDGNVEYKLKLDAPTMERVEHLMTQMAFRLNEGDGKAFYQIGVHDSGDVYGLSDEEILESLVVVFYMSTTLRPKVKIEMLKVRQGL